MIVKVQRPLSSNAEHTADLPYLVYDKDRLHYAPQQVAAEIKREIGTAPKAYFEAEWDAGTVMWKIGKRVKDQNW
jgi:hypothetical protein